MLKRFISIMGVLGYIAAGSTHAQYASVEQDREAKRAAEEQAVYSVRDSYVGRKFWIEPNRNALTRHEFLEKTEYDRPSRGKKFVVTAPTSFVVTGFVEDRAERFVEVAFEDGKAAYLKEYNLFSVNPREYPLFDNLYSLKETRYDFIEYILPMSPSDLQATLEKKRKKEAAAVAAWKARGGVSIGMTASQVKKSNWGAPSSINRTTGAYGVHEQWVYGDGNYIYFENGRVSAIQN